MDVSHYRDTRDYSDLHIKINGRDFKLHKFPLFLKSDYLRRLKSDSVEITDFPGGRYGTID